jgi:hypothetical protein
MIPKTWTTCFGYVLVFSAFSGAGESRSEKPSATPKALPREEALKKARGDKYAMLLRQFEVPQDAARHGDYRDAGRRSLQQYAGFTQLPPGYWVYVYPYWYIWRDRADTQKAKRPWGPEQATGPPDTPMPGDMVTAWASLTPDDQDEWLLLEYAEAVVPAAVQVHETFNPGALSRVTAFKLSGEEVEVWKGKDPTPPTAVQGVSEVPCKVSFKVNRVKLYFASKAVPGWNEIDAVGLRDTAERVHWATAAEASSTYAEQAGGAMPAGVVVFMPPPAGPRIIGRAVPAAPPPAPAAAPQPARAAPMAPAPAPARPDARDQRIERLEKEVRELKKEVQQLRDMLEKMKK